MQICIFVPDRFSIKQKAAYLQHLKQGVSEALKLESSDIFCYIESCSEANMCPDSSKSILAFVYIFGEGARDAYQDVVNAIADAAAELDASLTSDVVFREKQYPNLVDAGVLVQ